MSSARRFERQMAKIIRTTEPPKPKTGEEISLRRAAQWLRPCEIAQANRDALDRLGIRYVDDAPDLQAEPEDE